MNKTKKQKNLEDYLLFFFAAFFFAILIPLLC